MTDPRTALEEAGDDYCMGCEKCPPTGDWTCPECDTEWFDFPAIRIKAKEAGDGR